jgi:outer membrane receptor protein involved in Fe transport
MVFLSLRLFGQGSSINDTIRIKEVLVRSQNILSGSSGFKSSFIDSAVIKDYINSNLAEIISENTPVFIKSYGLGGVATTSFRGTGASHTQIAWNEVNINSPMLGQTDLSLIPAGFVDDIQVFHGGASMPLNSGGLGGIINIETKPSWKTESIMQVNLGAGSFGRYNGLLKVKTGSKDFQSVTKAFIQSAENNFRFLNNVISNESIWERRKNAQVSQLGFMQELYFKKEKSVKSARIWYQRSDRNLPLPMIVQQIGAGESQLDEFLRSILKYNRYDGNTDYDLSLSWFSDKLIYLNKAVSINSRNLSNTFTGKSGIETLVDGTTRLKIVLNDELNIINSVNYENRKTRNVATITASSDRVFGKRVGTMLLVRQILNGNVLLIPDFSAGIDFRIFNNMDYFLKGNVSKNSKVPSLNDLYWNPGGNPDLKSENSFTWELSCEMNNSSLSPINFKSEFTLFRNLIRNMIQWQPGAYSYWTPSNVNNVRTTGIETNFNLTGSIRSLKLRFNGEYTFNKANMITSNEENLVHGKQLMYIPEHQINAGLRISYKNFYSSWISNYTGRRYIETDNSSYLPGFALNDLIAGMKIKSIRNTIDLNIKLENLFNISYQAIAYHPMPRRSVMMTIAFQITK